MESHYVPEYFSLLFLHFYFQFLLLSLECKNKQFNLEPLLSVFMETCEKNSV